MGRIVVNIKLNWTAHAGAGRADRYAAAASSTGGCGAPTSIRMGQGLRKVLLVDRRSFWPRTYEDFYSSGRIAAIIHSARR